MKIPLATSAITAMLTLTAAHGAPLEAVPFTQVKVQGGFWGAYIDLDREKVLPHNFKYCESEGKIDNFAKAGHLIEGEHRGAPWEDSDVYKAIEGAAYCLAHRRSPEIEAVVDEWTRKIAAAQEPDGYLHTFHTLKNPKARWTDDSTHETYCAGHLIEGAVAYYQATGKRELLEVAIRFANHMDTVFGPGRQTDPSEHEEIELALVKLWRVTGEERYLDLAQFFVEARGRTEGRKPVPQNAQGIGGEYCQDHQPVREQTEIVGHAVRAMYLYCGVADLAAIRGDAGYALTVDRIWKDVTSSKMYVTGGIGPSARNEGFTVPYDLPNETAYCETCASVGMVLWNHRMTLLHADAKYADVAERAMYNGLLSGVSLDGEKYFYVNPLASAGQRHRSPWHGCSCCPTNIVRFLPTVGGYAYATGDSNIYANHYLASEANLKVAGVAVTLKQDTDYPWDGRVVIALEPERPAQFGLRLRIPEWCQGPQGSDALYTAAGKPEDGAATIALNGKRLKTFAIEKGYAVLDLEWKSGDVVELELPMPIRRIHANPKVAADAGRTALQRGPLVYCLEGVDNSENLRALALLPDAKLTAQRQPGLLNGVTVLQGKGVVRKAGGVSTRQAAITAVPYYSWDNRAPGAMLVWIPESVSLTAPDAKPSLASDSRSSTSFANGEPLTALNDQLEPKRSNDHEAPRLTWWPHLGTSEWVQYDLKRPCQVSAVEVYWFDDTGAGSCRVPKAWRVMYNDGVSWKPVAARAPGGTEPDKYNRIEFDPVRAAALRLEVELQPNFSGGILEWRVMK